MEVLIPNKVEMALVQRLMLIHRIQAAFLKLQGGLPKRFPRGPVQRELIKTLGLQGTGLTKRMINEALLGMGYRSVFIHGDRFYSRKE